MEKIPKEHKDALIEAHNMLKNNIKNILLKQIIDDVDSSNYRVYINTNDKFLEKMGGTASVQFECKNGRRYGILTINSSVTKEQHAPRNKDEICSFGNVSIMSKGYRSLLALRLFHEYVHIWFKIKGFYTSDAPNFYNELAAHNLQTRLFSEWVQNGFISEGRFGTHKYGAALWKTPSVNISDMVDRYNNKLSYDKPERCMDKAIFDKIYGSGPYRINFPKGW